MSTAARIVLDTNVIVSAFLSRNAPYRLLEALRESPSWHLVSSLSLLEELADVLTRPDCSRRLALLNRSAGNLIDDYLQIVDLVEPAQITPVVLADPDDDQVLACALAAQAELIVSGDADLLNLKSYQRIPIVDPGEALKRIERR